MSLRFLLIFYFFAEKNFHKIPIGYTKEFYKEVE